MLRWLILLPALLVSVWLAVANRQPVRFSLDPFAPDAPVLALELPLYAVLFGAGFVGLLLGGFVMWMAQGRYRRAWRKAEKRADRLESRIADADGAPARPG
ncbi:MAG: LapA family protein [Alphaproteobacteria bacterium]|nr:LapA family protein [Alphaproteobacteria bacterium]